MCFIAGYVLCFSMDDNIVTFSTEATEIVYTGMKGTFHHMKSRFPLSQTTISCIIISGYLRSDHITINLKSTYIHPLILVNFQH